MKMRMKIVCIVFIAFFILATTTGFADIIRLTDETIFEGTLYKETGLAYVFRVEGGYVKVGLVSLWPVADIEYRDPTPEELDKLIFFESPKYNVLRRPAGEFLSDEILPYEREIEDRVTKEATLNTTGYYFRDESKALEKIAKEEGLAPIVVSEICFKVRHLDKN